MNMCMIKGYLVQNKCLYEANGANMLHSGVVLIYKYRSEVAVQKDVTDNQWWRPWSTYY